jgi:bacillopeptidase F
MVILRLATATLLVAPATTAAGILDAALEAHLASHVDTALVPVLIVLADQVPIGALDAELRAEGATRAHRHARVIAALRSTAESTQSPLLVDLASLLARGEVSEYTPYWIVNAIAARAHASVLRAIAARADVGAVALDARRLLADGPVDSPGADGSALAGATPGLRAIGADRVWRELGITGTGRIVCGLDTGVMGTHPALAARWRGAAPGIPWQWAWKDVLGGNTQFPIDPNGHGTHTMGTALGLATATSDTLGVAWGARWIACNAIGQGAGPALDSDVIACFQWIADPDGDPQTTSDVPDVTMAAWRVNEQLGYPDCDARWWGAIDACEAAGCAVVFSAGGDGPGAMTIGSPADRITTPTNALAIGAVSAQAGETFPYAIAAFSSRGPSGCDGVTKKPELVAPGVNILSSTNDGSYAYWSGTAMTVPHVAGAIALMREADPDLDVATAKQILLETARDEGESGDDNTYGSGFVDAYAAVSCVLAAQGIGGAGGAPPARQIELAVEPNPLRRSTGVRYGVPTRGPVRLAILDIQGRVVRTLVHGIVEAGAHRLVYDGRDDAGDDLPSGVYFLRLEACGHRAVEKMGLVR